MLNAKVNRLLLCLCTVTCNARNSRTFNINAQKKQITDNQRHIRMDLGWFLPFVVIRVCPCLLQSWIRAFIEDSKQLTLCNSLLAVVRDSVWCDIGYPTARCRPNWHILKQVYCKLLSSQSRSQINPHMYDAALNEYLVCFVVYRVDMTEMAREAIDVWAHRVTSGLERNWS